MARKTLNRRELREASEAAERQEAAAKTEGKAEAKKPAAKPKRKSRAKAAKEVRLKAFWGVFSQSLNQVAQFEYSDRDEADKKAEELSESKKSPHFVQLVKKVIDE
jgi:hypothetical protein